MRGAGPHLLVSRSPYRSYICPTPPLILTVPAALIGLIAQVEGLTEGTAAELSTMLPEQLGLVIARIGCCSKERP